MNLLMIKTISDKINIINIRNQKNKFKEIVYMILSIKKYTNNLKKDTIKKNKLNRKIIYLIIMALSGVVILILFKSFQIERKKILSNMVLTEEQKTSFQNIRRTSPVQMKIFGKTGIAYYAVTQEETPEAVKKPCKLVESYLQQFKINHSIKIGIPSAILITALTSYILE